MSQWKQVIATMLLAVLSSAAAAESLEGYTVMALSPLDERAVIKLPDNKMQVLKPGDAIDGTQATVEQVLTDRLVLEETITLESGGEGIETVWFYKAVDGRSRVERLRRQPPAGERGLRTVSEQVK